MKKTILHVMKRYESNAPLINSMVKPENDEFRTLACYLSGEPDGKNNMETIAAETIYSRIPKKKVTWTQLSTCRKLADIIDEKGVDLLVCQFRRAIPIGVIAARLSSRKPKVVGVLHGIVGGKVGYGRKLLNYVIYKQLAKLVSVSEKGIDDIVRLNIALDRNKLTAIPNGLGCAPFLAEPRLGRADIFPEFGERDFVFGMVGRLAPVKNQGKVLEAFARIAEDFPAAKLGIFGSGPLEAELKEQVRSLQLDDRVRFMGHSGNIPDVLKSLDCFVMPSLREGFPMALMEAMVSGLPIITSRVGGMWELIPDQSFGILVDPRSVDSIANAMKAVLQSPPDANRRLGENAKTRVLEHFTDETMADRYEELYRQTLSDV
ncbi:glycosyltransferase family 4 protein [Proteobacteria bacterium 005FR1]|nr:glycosyltransferase family 4 protein [Proteobacteria bacterium 005FR1]